MIDWKIRKEVGYRGETNWKFGRLYWIPENREICWSWLKEGEWQSKTLLKY